MSTNQGTSFGFLAYLEEREQSEATQELLDIPGFETAFQAASQEAKVRKAVRFEDIRLVHRSSAYQE
jgi:hypothetical protein